MGWLGAYPVPGSHRTQPYERIAENLGGDGGQGAVRSTRPNRNPLRPCQRGGNTGDQSLAGGVCGICLNDLTRSTCMTMIWLNGLEVVDRLHKNSYTPLTPPTSWQPGSAEVKLLASLTAASRPGQVRRKSRDAPSNSQEQAQEQPFCHPRAFALALPSNHETHCSQQ